MNEMLSRTRREAEQRADEWERTVGKLPKARETLIEAYMDGACWRMERTIDRLEKRLNGGGA